MKKNQTIFFSLFFFCCLLFSFASCTTDKKTNQYTVSFYVGNTCFQEQKVNEHECAIVPENPTQDINTFVGWYLDGATETVYDFSTPIDNDLTLFARFSKNYVVTFYEDDNIIDTKVIADGTPCEQPLNPTRDDDSFVGWYLDSDLTVSYNFSTPVQSNLSLYAKFEINYQVTYLVNGEEYAVNHYPAGALVEENNDVVLDDLYFLGWYSTNSYQTRYDFTKPLTEDIIIYGNASKTGYQVSFYDGSYAYKKLSFSYGQKLNFAEPRDKEGYNFVGWYDESGEQVTNEDNLIVSKNMKLYSKYEEKERYTIDYVLGDDVYLTKKDLFISFFTDFYNFIMTTYPEDNNLIKEGVNNVETFLTIAASWTYGSQTNMTAIGNIAGRYYLKPMKDGTGKLETQPANYFIGYCYKNHMYEEFIPFLIDFFEEWRRSEGYTTATNHGSDFFYESWAPLVDTGKLFYFTRDTCPSYHNETIKNDFDTIPGVLYGKENNQIYYAQEKVVLQTLTRTGYEFVGWYYDLDDETTKVTTIESIESNVTLYAKWKKNA